MMSNWLTSFDRKKHQRRVNRYVRAVNKNIASDDLWRGRFVVRQVGSPVFYIYEDKSGAELTRIHLVVTDLKTGQKCHDWDSGNGWCNWNGSYIWTFVNKAITEIFDVWTGDSNPYDFRDDPMHDFNNPKVCAYWRKKWVS